MGRASKSVVLAVLCALAFSGATAQAGDVVTSKVTLKVKRDVRFKGKVRSPASDCAVGRKVRFYRQQRGRDKLVAKAFASESATYSVKIRKQRGSRIYALVKHYRTPLDTVCERDRSRVVRV